MKFTWALCYVYDIIVSTIYVYIYILFIISATQPQHSQPETLNIHSSQVKLQNPNFKITQHQQLQLQRYPNFKLQNYPKSKLQNYQTSKFKIPTTSITLLQPSRAAGGAMRCIRKYSEVRAGVAGVGGERHSSLNRGSAYNSRRAPPRPDYGSRATGFESLRGL